MLSQEKAMTMIEDSIAGLRRAGLLGADLAVDGGLVLLGTGSPLDSIAFVTFITDLEDRLNGETGKDLYLVLTDIHEFNTDNARLTVETLARYLVKLAQQ